ncbi:ribosome binding protein [Babesia ovata]|uniref:Ribosome binding protein n=1 Tax=Babesia ovata TaxID=189622 RepID=A0A2H6K9I0_9APIC|nr:ribosome binding protein [Babesia ovata]GBE59643.1 ribosome binding protein [Babesia ovata]
MAADIPQLNTLSEILQFLEWLQGRRGKINQVASALARDIEKYFNIPKRAIQSIMIISLNNLRDKMTKLRDKLLINEITKLYGYNRYGAPALLDALLKCVPQLYAALSFLLYNVSDNYESVGGGQWAEQDTISPNSDLHKYLTSSTAGYYNGIIPGGFYVVELKSLRGSSLVEPLKGAVSRGEDTAQTRGTTRPIFRDHFTNVLATTLNRPWQDVNTGNALLLLRAFQEIVVEEVDRKNGGETKKALDKGIKPHQVCWADLYKHFAKFQATFAKVFNDGGFGFTGQVSKIQKKKEFVEAFSKWFRDNYQHIKQSVSIMSGEIDRSDLHSFARKRLYPYGLIFRYGGTNQWERTLETHWDSVISMFDAKGHELERLKDILEGSTAVLCPETRESKTKAAKPVVTKAKTAKPKTSELPPAKVPEVPKSRLTPTKSEGALNQSKRSEGKPNQGRKSGTTLVSPNQNNGQSEGKPPPSQVVNFTASTPTSGNDGPTGPQGAKGAPGPPGPPGPVPPVSSHPPDSSSNQGVHVQQPVLGPSVLPPPSFPSSPAVVSGPGDPLGGKGAGSVDIVTPSQLPDGSLQNGPTKHPSLSSRDPGPSDVSLPDGDQSRDDHTPSQNNPQNLGSSTSLPSSPGSGGIGVGGVSGDGRMPVGSQSEFQPRGITGSAREKGSPEHRSQSSRKDVLIPSGTAKHDHGGSSLPTSHPGVAGSPAGVGATDQRVTSDTSPSPPSGISTTVVMSQPTTVSNLDSVSSSVPGPIGGSSHCADSPKAINHREQISPSHVASVANRPSHDMDPGSVSQPPKTHSPQSPPISTAQVDHSSNADHSAESESATTVPFSPSSDPSGSAAPGGGGVGDAEGETSPGSPETKPCTGNASHMSFGGVTWCHHKHRTFARSLYGGQKTPHTLWEEHEKREEENRRQLRTPYLSRRPNQSVYTNPGRFGDLTSYPYDNRFRAYLQKGNLSGKETYVPPPRIPLYDAYRHGLPLIGYEGPDILNEGDPGEEWIKSHITLQQQEFRNQNEKIITDLITKVLQHPSIQLSNTGIAVGKALKQPKPKTKPSPLPHTSKLEGQSTLNSNADPSMIAQEELPPSLSPPTVLEIQRPPTQENDTMVLASAGPLQSARIEPKVPVKDFPDQLPNLYEPGEGIQHIDEEADEQYAPYYSVHVMPNIDICRDPWHVSPYYPDPDQLTPSPPPESDHLPPPTTVRGILYWLVGIVALEYIGILKKHVEGIFEDVDKDDGFTTKPSYAIDIIMSHPPLTASLVTRTMTEACYYAASVLCRLKHIQISDVIKDFDFSSEYQKYHYSSDPDDLLCQVRDYVYAAHHQVAFLRLQCYREEFQGGWKDFKYGSNVNVSSSILQAFLTDDWNSACDTYFFNPCNACLKSRVRMGFSDVDLPKQQQTGSTLLGILSPNCDPYDPLLTLSSYLVCITRQTPSTTGELVSFFHHFGNVLYEYDPDTFSDLGAALIDNPLDYFFWAHLEDGDLEAVRNLRGCDPSIQCHDHYNTLSTLIGCDIYPIPCPQLFLPITYPTYALYSPIFVHTYLSWMLYLPDRLHDSLDRLRRDLKENKCSGIKPLHNCNNAMSTLYLHGFAPPYGYAKPPPNCSDVIVKLSSVVSGGPVAKLLTCADDFLYRARKPFVVFVFTLWFIAIICFAHTQLYRLDVLRIRSHIMLSKASHLINVKALLSLSKKMPSLYRVDYFDDEII